MVYEVFQTAVSEELKNRLGKDFQVSIRKIPKNNGTALDGLTIFRLNESVTPTFYLQSYYEAYEQGRDMESIIMEIIQIYRKHLDQAPFDIHLFEDFSKMKDRVALKLIHTSSNRELLADIPSMPFHDLSIVFYLFLDKDENGQMTILIHNSHLSLWNTNVSELFQLSLKNSPKLYPACIRSMTSLIQDMLFINHSFVEPPKNRPCGADAFADIEDINPLYILTNRTGIFGAGTILYPGVLKEFASQRNQDLIILPSSIHEVLLLPYEPSISFKELASMVAEINQSCVLSEERLSNHVYFYSRKQDSVFLADDPASDYVS